MKKNEIFVLIPAVLLLLFIPFVWRLSIGNFTLPGEYSYYYLSLLTRFGIPSLHFHVVYWLLSILCTFFLALLFYRIVKVHTPSTFARITATLFFVFTPVTLSFSMSVSPYLFAVILLFLGLNLIESRYVYVSILPFLGLLFFDWLTFLSSVIIVVGYFLYAGKKRLVELIPFVVLFTALFVFINFFLRFPFVIEKTHPLSLLVGFFSNFGSTHGIGIFMILLSIMGIAFSWQYKQKSLPVYICTALLLILFLFAGEPALYFLNPMIVSFASSAYISLWQREWALSLIRTLTLATLAYGILFSGLASITQKVYSGPTQDLLVSVEWLHNHPFYSNAIVLSHPQKGFWLESDGIRRAYVNYLDDQSKTDVAQQIFESRDYKKTSALLEENGITILWIDEKMRNGQVWNEGDEGLLFLLNSGVFSKVYDARGVEIWRFKLT